MDLIIHCVSLSNQKCKVHPTIINLHPNEYSHEFHYYSFSVKLDRCVGSCNTINDVFNKVCAPNNTEDLNVSVFNMTAGTSESKALTKHISCECKCKLDGTKCNSNQWSNNDNINVSLKSIMYVKKIIFGKYLASIMDDSVITCDEGIEWYDEEIKTVSTNFNEKI